jgi:hypothetical protein
MAILNSLGKQWLRCFTLSYRGKGPEEGPQAMKILCFQGIASQAAGCRK